MNVPHETPRKAKMCSLCRQERDRPGQVLCRKCHANYMKKWRSEHVYVKRTA